MSSSTNSYPSEYTDLVKAVTRLETKIDQLITQHTAQDAELKSIRSRVESLERGRAHSKGVTAVLTAIGGLVGGIVTMVVKNYLPHQP